MSRTLVVSLLISLAIPLTAQAQDTPEIPGPPPAPATDASAAEPPATTEAPATAAGDAAQPTAAPTASGTAQPAPTAAAPTAPATATPRQAAPAPSTSATLEMAPAARRSPARVAVTPSGATGVLRVSAADSVPKGNFRIGLGFDFFRVGTFFESGDDHTRFGGTLSLSGSPIDYFEAWFNLRAASNSNNFTDPSLLQTQGDAALGVKGFYPVGNLLSIGADMQVTFLSGIGDTSFDFSGTELRFRALVSSDFTKSEAAIPLRLHINIGYVLDNSDALINEDEPEPTQAQRFSLGINDFSRVTFGAAVEAPFKYITPYLEYTAEFPVSPQYLATPGVVAVGQGLRTAQATPPEVTTEPARPAYQRIVPQIITPGIRITAIPKLTLDLAVDIGITPDEVIGVPSVPPYNIQFWASYPIDLVGSDKGVSGPPISVPVVIPEAVEAAPTQGSIAGVVTDQETQAPLANAVVKFDRSPPVATADSGRFRSLDMEPGPVQITVTKDGYEPSTGTVEILANDEPEIAVALQPLVREGTIRGRVTDDEDKPLADAAVSVEGPTQKSLSTDADGRFELTGVEGKYVVSVDKVGYLSKAKTFELSGGETISADVLVRKRPKKEIVEVKGDRIFLRGKVHFITGEARLEPDASALLDNMVDFLVRSADVKLRIEGHTDNVGGDATNLQLSRDRAESVKAYLTDNGIDPARLTTEGFGPSRPLAPNLTRRGREQNRRVEFHIEK